MKSPKPSKRDLLNHIIDNELNVWYTPSADCTDMEPVEDDPEIYLSEHYDEVINSWLDEQSVGL